MRMRHLVWVGGFVVVSVVGCGKKSDGTASDPMGSTSVLQNVAYNVKPPARGSRPVSQKAVNGGSGITVPSVSSQKLSEASTDRSMRTHAKEDMADCKTLPDDAAECDGTNLYFCDDSKLWVVDCNAEAKFGGASAGACFEGEKFIDCLGKQAADDGSDVWCDFQTTVCCDKDGSCYSPK